MNYEILLQEGLKHQVKITIAAADLSERLNARVNELATQMKIPGFRPGKVPPAHIKKIHGRSIMNEILPSMVKEQINSMLAELDARPAYEPEIKLDDSITDLAQLIDTDQALILEATFETVPEFDLGVLEGLDLERPVALVTEDKIDTACDTLLAQNRPYSEKTGDAVVAEYGDKVRIQSVAQRNGEPFPALSADDTELVLSDNPQRGIPEITEALQGAAVGDARQAIVDGKSRGLEGDGDPSIEVSLTVLGISAPDAMDLNTLAQQLGLDGEEKLRSELRGQIEAEYEKRSNERLKRRLLDAVASTYEFALPERLVQQELEQIKRQRDAAAKDAEDSDANDIPSDEEALQLAQRRILLGLVFMRAGSEAKIQITSEEIAQGVRQYAQMHNLPEKEVQNYFANHDDALEREVRMPLYEDRIIEDILKRAKITDKTVTVEELQTDDPSPFEGKSSSAS